MTGKSQSANKAKTYQRLLPVVIENDQLSKREQQAGFSRRGAPPLDTSAPYIFPAWADYILSLCGYCDSSSTSSSILPKQKERENLDVVVGTWDPLSKSVYLDVTIPSTSRSHSDVRGGEAEEEQEQSSSMRYLWESGFFGKGTLSRSEPTWHKREVNAIRVKRERERGGKGEDIIDCLELQP